MSKNKNLPSEEEVEAVLDKMVAKGYMECNVIDGKKCYKVTPLGLALKNAKDHKNSDTNKRN